MDSQLDGQTDSQCDAQPMPKRRRLEILPAIPTELKPNDMFYSMKRPERGLAIIFNHEFYDEIDGEKPEIRHGTSQDVEKLMATFGELGFQIDIQENLTHDEIIKHVWEVSGNEDLKCHDCLVVVVLTHGLEQDAILAKDRTYSVKELVTPFVGRNCLYLANKPKLFFIQACKGKYLQRKVNLMTMMDGTKFINGNKENIQYYSIPSNSDVLISYATLEGYIALRDPTWGTPYINILCNELEKYGTTSDLVTILIRVHHTLSTSTFHLEGSVELIKVQPSFLCYLNRFVRFDAPTFSKAQTQP
ncbi:Caspase-1 [Blattella germanica]|nr:Caspase-1 [Blattella germanica]